MKKFEIPEISIETFKVEDVITTSNPEAEEDMGDWA